jgi:hypothetical protein
VNVFGTVNLGVEGASPIMVTAGQLPFDGPGVVVLTNYSRDSCHEIEHTVALLPFAADRLAQLLTTAAEHARGSAQETAPALTISRNQINS